jgi:hypothetical protein
MSKPDPAARYRTSLLRPTRRTMKSLLLRVFRKRKMAVHREEIVVQIPEF